MRETVATSWTLLGVVAVIRDSSSFTAPEYYILNFEYWIRVTLPI